MLNDGRDGVGLDRSVMTVDGSSEGAIKGSRVGDSYLPVDSIMLGSSELIFVETLLGIALSRLVEMDVGSAVGATNGSFVGRLLAANVDNDDDDKYVGDGVGCTEAAVPVVLGSSLLIIDGLSVTIYVLWMEGNEGCSEGSSAYDGLEVSGE